MDPALSGLVRLLTGVVATVSPLCQHRPAAPRAWDRCTTVSACAAQSRGSCPCWSSVSRWPERSDRRTTCCSLDAARLMATGGVVRPRPGSDARQLLPVLGGLAADRRLSPSVIASTRSPGCCTVGSMARRLRRPGANHVAAFISPARAFVLVAFGRRLDTSRMCIDSRGRRELVGGDWAADAGWSWRAV
jgi:hypothetical protein